MGNCIHYRGWIKSPTLVPELIKEVKDIAEIMEWRYEILDDDWSAPADVRLETGKTGRTELVGNAGLKGIIFKPEPRYDPIYMTFTKKGLLIDPFSLALRNSNVLKERTTWMWAKCSVAPDYVHMAVCKLLRHLSAKYFKKFYVKDETEYWETGDEALLHEKQDRMRALIDAFANGLEKEGLDYLKKLGIHLDEDLKDEGE